MYQHNMSLNVKCFHLWNSLKQKTGVTDVCVLVRSVVIMAVTTRFTIFWDAIPCSPVDMYQYVQMASRNLLLLSSGKKTVATHSSKMSVPTYQSTSCHTPEDILFLYISDTTVHDIWHIMLFCAVQIYQWKNYDLYLRWSDMQFTSYVVSVDKTKVLQTQRQHNK